jgi:hypothetical protein
MEPRPENEMKETYVASAPTEKEGDSPLFNAIMYIVAFGVLALLIYFFGAGSGTEVIQH